MTHNTSKFQIDGGLESADIGVLVRGVKNENFPCPARLRALKSNLNIRANTNIFRILYLSAPNQRIFVSITVLEISAEQNCVILLSIDPFSIDPFRINRLILHQVLTG